jgi:hypothetical protein
MSTTPSIFADGIIEASVTHGVARLTLAQAGGDGKPFPVGQLAIPLVQLPSLVRSLSGLLQQIEEKMRQQAQTAAPGAAATAQSQPAGPEVASPTLSGAFRFG